MGVSKTITVICDYSGCGGGQNGPQVLQWSETEVERGRAEQPELAKYLVLINHLGVLKSFCCQLHAAEYFLPPGYEAVQKKVIELPERKGEPGVLTPRVRTWMDEPGRHEAIEQADGNPDNGQEPA